MSPESCRTWSFRLLRGKSQLANLVSIESLPLLNEHVSHSPTTPLKCALLVTLLMTAIIKHSVKISKLHLKQSLFVLLHFYHKELSGFSEISNNSTGPLKAVGGWPQKSLPSKVLIALKLQPRHSLLQDIKSCFSLQQSAVFNKVINKSKNKKFCQTMTE